MNKTSTKVRKLKVIANQNSTHQEFRLDPPDGGWAWVVLIATFIAGLNTVAAMSTFAVILNNLASLLSTNTATLLWTPSVEISTGLFLGPLCTTTINKYGCRRATIFGGILVSSGLIASYFVTRVEFLIVTYGVIVGMGSGICYIVFPVILSHYFKRYFGVAVGCMMASYAASRMIMTPLAQILLDEYGCRATMLLMGAVTLHICVGGCLYRPVKYHSHTETASAEGGIKSSEVKRVELILQETTDKGKSVEIKEEAARLIEGKKEKPTEDIYRNRKLNFETLKYKVSTEYITTAVDENIANSDSGNLDENTCKPSLSAKRLYRTADFNMLKTPLFYIVSLGEWIIVVIMIYSNVFLFPLGIEIGLPPMRTASVISAKAAADIFGRIAGPSLITLLKLSTRYSFVILNAVHAIILAAFMMANSYEIYTSMSIMSGLIFGVVVGLKNVLITECMGVKRLPSVIGMSAFLQGFLMLPVPPTLGYIRDSAGSFKEIFFFLSGMEIVVVILWSLKPLLSRLSK